MEKRPLGLFGYSYQVERYIPNLDFHPHALVFKQLQRFGYAINVEQMPDNPNYLHCTTLNVQDAGKITQLLTLVQRDPSYHARHSLLSLVFGGEFTGISAFMNAREHVTQEIRQGTEPPPRRTANPLTGETLQRAFLLSVDRFHELYEGKQELVLKTQIDRKKYLRALAQYKRYTDNGLTPLDLDEVAGLSLGPNFSSIWRDHPELHP